MQFIAITTGLGHSVVYSDYRGVCNSAPSALAVTGPKATTETEVSRGSKLGATPKGAPHIIDALTKVGFFKGL